MENLIPSSKISNRKVILEVRFKSNPLILDKRGEIVRKLVSSDVIKNSHWELGNGEIKLVDSLENDLNRNTIFINMNRISVISSKFDSNQSFFNQFEQSYKILTEIIGSDLEITRVGCRVLGTYKAKSSTYSDVLKNFKSFFNTSIFLDDFQARDLMFSIVYDNGRYVVGPINKEDGFLEKEFSYEGCVKSIGFGIDTDNFILNTDKSKITIPKIKDVFIASISVENSLFNKLSSI